MKISTTLDMYCVDDGDKERYVSSATNNANTWIDEKIEDKDNPAECKCGSINKIRRLDLKIPKLNRLIFLLQLMREDKDTRVLCMSIFKLF